jgi:hypothetical protein
MFECVPIDAAGANWQELDIFADRTIFQKREWIEFLAETKHAVPVLAEVRDGAQVVGYFTGLTFQKMGVKILGSPFPGWTTPYMGFNLLPGAPRQAALAAVEKLAFGALKCLHMEIADPMFTVEDGQGLGFTVGYYDSYQTDLRKSEDEIFGAMDGSCRRCVRKAEKSGVLIEEAHDLEFADEYYAQLLDVFAKQTKMPSYGVDRVRALIRHLEPTGQLLLVRARDPDGKCIGTGIFPGLNRIAQFWGNASFRWGQILRPNEAIQWYAMRYWKRRGVELYDWGGGGEYKEKYGCTPLRIPFFSKSRYKVLGALRDEAKKMVARKHNLMGRFNPARKPD